MLVKTQKFETACGTDLIVDWHKFPNNFLLMENVIWTHYESDHFGQGKKSSFNDDSIGGEIWERETRYAENEARNGLIQAEILRREGR